MIISQIQQFLKCDLIANGTIFCTQTKRANLWWNEF